MTQFDGYLGNPNLKRVGVTLNFTEEQVKEYILCSQDPNYFIENYVKIVNVDRGLIPFDMYAFQRKMIKTFHENRFTIAKMPRQVGKCFCINTPIRLRNKKTGEITETTVGEFYEQQRKYSEVSNMSAGNERID